VRPEPTSGRPAAEPSRWGGPRLALAAVLAGAAALRIPGLENGLPYATLLNPDEQSIVPRAWHMVHGGGLDPHWFDYPTFVLYLFAPFQAWQDRPSVLTARIIVLGLALGAVAATWWLGNRAYGALAGTVGAAIVSVETTHVLYSHMAVTDVALTLGIAVSLGLMISGRLEWAGLAAGLATGAKYPGVFLAVPLVVAGWRQWRRVAVGCALGALAFLATSPYVLVHPGQAAHEAFRVQRLAREGWLGFEHDHVSLVAFPARLWSGMGPVLIVAAAGLAFAAWRRRRTDLILAAFVLVYFIDLLTLRAHFDRYVLPLVPPLGVLAGRLRTLAPVTLLLLAIPLTWSIRKDIELARTDTRIAAHDWIERHLPAGARVAADSSTPPLEGFDVLPLALPGPKRPFDPNRNVARLRGEGIRYALVTGAIADRVLAARDRYPREARFYDELRAHEKRLYYVSAGHGLSGPWVAVYRV
jgi:4-amino-4-deoxy-L-arabinose transferase-like glycosyltransferase